MYLHQFWSKGATSIISARGGCRRRACIEDSVPAVRWETNQWSHIRQLHTKYFNILPPSLKGYLGAQIAKLFLCLSVHQRTTGHNTGIDIDAMPRKSIVKIAAQNTNTNGSVHFHRNQEIIPASPCLSLTMLVTTKPAKVTRSKAKDLILKTKATIFEFTDKTKAKDQHFIHT